MRFWLVGLLALGVLGGCTASNEYLVGEELYERSCVACHGVDGEGGIGSDIGGGSNTDLNLSDDQIAGVITIGPGNMPAFSRLTTEQVDSLVRYVRGLSE